VLERLSVDASASFAAPEQTGSETNRGLLSPALAHALFALAMAPLLSNADDDNDPLRALSAYRR